MNVRTQDEVFKPKGAAHPTTAFKMVPGESDRARKRVYDLRAESESSDQFFRDIADFSDEVLRLVEGRGASLIDDFCRYSQRSSGRPLLSRGEYALELLTLGMVLHRYEPAACNTPRWVQATCYALLLLRSHSGSAKPIVDWLRGGIAMRFLLPARHSEAPRFCGPVERLEKLVRWLGSCAEMKQEAVHLRQWLAYARDMGVREASQLLKIAEEIFAEFSQLADLRLCAYTTNVAQFIQRDRDRPECREDLLLRSKTAAEYHLNMVASELMNRGLRRDFEAAIKHVVLLPTCMRRDPERCKAVKDGIDIRCMSCDPLCSIDRVSRIMRTRGVHVYMVPHASGFSRWLRRWQNSGTAVTAAACMLHILPGGYEMRERNIPSQCVPLDFPGCRKHWDDVGIPTALNERRLVQITTIVGASKQRD